MKGPVERGCSRTQVSGAGSSNEGKRKYFTPETYENNQFFDLILIFKGPVGWGGGNVSYSNHGTKLNVPQCSPTSYIPLG